MNIIEQLASYANTFNNIAGRDVIQNVIGEVPISITTETAKNYILFLKQDENNVKSLKDSLECNRLIYEACSEKKRKKLKPYYDQYDNLIRYLAKEFCKTELN